MFSRTLMYKYAFGCFSFSLNIHIEGLGDMHKQLFVDGSQLLSLVGQLSSSDINAHDGVPVIFLLCKHSRKRFTGRNIYAPRVICVHEMWFESYLLGSSV